MNLWYVGSQNTYYILDRVDRIIVINVLDVLVEMRDGTTLHLTGYDAEELCGHLQAQVPRSQQIKHFGEDD